MRFQSVVVEIRTTWHSGSVALAAQSGSTPGASRRRRSKMRSSFARAQGLRSSIEGWDGGLKTPYATSRW